MTFGRWIVAPAYSVPWRKWGEPRNLLAGSGIPCTDPMEMRGTVRAFYASRISSDLTDTDACGVLWDGLPMVSAGDQDRMELLLSLAEFSAALCLMATSKSPSYSGLTMAFYHVSWDILSPDFAIIWAEALGSK